MAQRRNLKTDLRPFDIAQLALHFLDGFEPGFDRFTLTIAQAWKFRGEDPIHVDFEGEARIIHDVLIKFIWRTEMRRSSLM